MDRSTTFRAALTRACVRFLRDDHDCTKCLALELKGAQQALMLESGSGAAVCEHPAPSFARVMDQLWRSAKSVEEDRALIFAGAATSFFTDAQLCEVCDLLVVKYHGETDSD